MPRAFAAALAASPLATVIAAVKSVGVKTMRPTTVNGRSNMIPNELENPGLKPSERVHLTWTVHDKHRVLSSAAIVK